MHLYGCRIDSILAVGCPVLSYTCNKFVRFVLCIHEYIAQRCFILIVSIGLQSWSAIKSNSVLGIRCEASE